MRFLICFAICALAAAVLSEAASAHRSKRDTEAVAGVSEGAESSDVSPGASVGEVDEADQPKPVSVKGAPKRPAGRNQRGGVRAANNRRAGRGARAGARRAARRGAGARRAGRNGAGARRAGRRVARNRRNGGGRRAGGNARNGRRAFKRIMKARM